MIDHFDLSNDKPRPERRGECVLDLICIESYAEYLNTEHWQELRAAKLEEAEGRCQVCNSPNRLEVHHRTYERKCYERLADLCVLCNSCHNRFHQEMPQWHG